MGEKLPDETSALWVNISVRDGTCPSGGMSVCMTPVRNTEPKTWRGRLDRFEQAIHAASLDICHTRTGKTRRGQTRWRFPLQSASRSNLESPIRHS
jgi:hypothetical protein